MKFTLSNATCHVFNTNRDGKSKSNVRIKPKTHLTVRDHQNKTRRWSHSVRICSGVGVGVGVEVRLLVWAGLRIVVSAQVPSVMFTECYRTNAAGFFVSKLLFLILPDQQRQCWTLDVSIHLCRLSFFFFFRTKITWPGRTQRAAYKSQRKTKSADLTPEALQADAKLQFQPPADRRVEASSTLPAAAEQLASARTTGPPGRLNPQDAVRGGSVGDSGPVESAASDGHAEFKEADLQTLVFLKSWTLQAVCQCFAAL